METGFTLGGSHVEATDMFAGILLFTTIAASQDPADTLELLDNYSLSCLIPLPAMAGR